MTGLALGLVLSSAFMHAFWNYFAKRVRSDGVFIWLISLVSTIVYTPAAIYIIVTQRPEIGLLHLAFMAGSAIIHIVYFLLLSRGYQTGDLSLVYPLARGTGPLLSTIGAILLLGERPTIITVAGTILIGIGVFILTGDPRKLRQSGNQSAMMYAFLTGCTIATYTIFDRQAVAVLLIPPLLYDWGNGTVRTLLMTPYGLRNLEKVRFYLREHKTELAAVSLLSPFSYILMLTALSFTPVSTIAPLREISILIGAALGMRLLAERDVWRRLAAAGVMMIGVFALALG